jgi:hypothetical protein
VPGRANLTHWIYPYRGKFHPQMVRALFNILGVKPGGSRSEAIPRKWDGSVRSLLARGERDRRGHLSALRVAHEGQDAIDHGGR